METLTAKASRSLVILKDHEGVAADIADRLDAHALHLADATPRFEYESTTWGRWPGTVMKASYEPSRERIVATIRRETFGSREIMLQFLALDHSVVLKADPVDLVTSMAVLLRGGAGPVDDLDMMEFDLAATMCSGDPVSVGRLPILHSPTPYQEALLYDEGPKHQVVADVPEHLKATMRALRPMTRVEAVKERGRPLFAYAHAHVDQCRGSMNTVELLRERARIDRLRNEK